MLTKIRSQLKDLMTDNTSKEEADLIAKIMVSCDEVDVKIKEQKDKYIDLQKDYIKLTKNQIFKTGEDDGKDNGSEKSADLEDIINEVIGGK